ncbi:helix-turn-helix domain-containing protein [Bacillus altitudinis]|uniref:helix-turn-helix domain-containing protein n=1 Tax=Bacillus altitudinis TaxID=293387 RepID=UPI002E20CD06|nr:helix-turn-helix domain-containing protein [Bacillus altitudinis]
MTRRQKEIKLKPSYKPLEHMLIRKDKKKTDLRNELGLSPNTVAKISAGEFVAMTVIAQLCDYLDCRIEDIVEFVPNDTDDQS